MGAYNPFNSSFQNNSIFGGKKPWEEMIQGASMNSSPVPTTGNGAIDFLGDKGMDTSGMGMASEIGKTDQFSPIAPQSTEQMLDANSFDVAGMAKDLGKGLEAYNKNAPKAPAAPKGSIIGQPMRTGSAAPVAQPKQAIGQAAPVSNAMQTIQNQNLGSVPTIQDVLKMRQLGLR
jgi:hypothetical protein